MGVLLKVLAVVAIVALATRLFVRRDSEIARRFRIFVDVSLLVVAVGYGARLIQQWL